MYTNKNYLCSWLAFMFHERLCSRFRILMAVTLILLSTTSDGHLVPSQAVRRPSLRSDSSLSSNALREYIVYSLVEGPSMDSENEKIRLHLGMISAPADVQEYGGDHTGVEFWRVKMNDIQRTAFMSANPKVGQTPLEEDSRGNPEANEREGSNPREHPVLIS